MEKEECRVDEIIIKPHHFIDIIKLYGAGIERFIPDEPMGHDSIKSQMNLSIIRQSM